MAEVLCIGIAVQDAVYGLRAMPVSAEKHRAQSLEIVGGGIAANAAVAVARLGGRARLVTRLGDDSTGRDIVAELESEGVDCRWARCFPGLRSSQSAILVDANGERMVINYSDPAMPDDTAWLPAELPPGARAVMGDTRWEKGALRLFEAARTGNGFGVLDGDRAVKTPELLSAATHIIFAAQALREMTGCDAPSDGLLQLPVPDNVWLAVTDGVRGTYIRTANGVESVPAFAVQAVDTLAAGDVYHGAFALALAEGMNERRAVRFASAVAAIKCTRFGGRKGTPNRHDVDLFLKGHEA